MDIRNPHNEIIERGTPTSVRAADGRRAIASWTRPEWMLILPGKGQAWTAWTDLPADIRAAVTDARR